MRWRLPGAADALVVNTGPIIALGRIDALAIVEQLRLDLITPSEVAAEIDAGAQLGYPVRLPAWIRIVPLAGSVAALPAFSLDKGEAAVIALALERGIATVCIDEWRGRRAAIASGLRVTGSLGLLGRAKSVGVIDAVKPWVEKLEASGSRYHPGLLARFLEAMGEA